jgi:hypothetical protein
MTDNSIERPAQESTGSAAPSIDLPPLPEYPNLQALYQGHRVRLVGGQFFLRPPEETLHEFLIRLLLITLQEVAKPHKLNSLCRQHEIRRCFRAYRAWKRANATAENEVVGGWVAPPTGDVFSLLTLANDIYLLRKSRNLCVETIQRLLTFQEFQGARYEIAVAAIFARLGYRIDYFPTNLPEKHPEFLAIHRTAGVTIAVEAKSRRRPGVLHEAGKTDLEAASQGDIDNLFHDAMKQIPQDKPAIVFIDLIESDLVNGNYL